jgi:CheY-like chemotaxis protein
MAMSEAVSQGAPAPLETSVLVVDDDPAVCELLGDLVHAVSEQAEVRVANDGDSALAMARQRRPDLVLLDIVLRGSGISGVMACQELCRDPLTRVVVMSGHAPRAVVDACLRLGALEYVQKPIPVAEMYAHLLDWLGRSHPLAVPSGV